MIYGLDLFSGIGGLTLALEPWVRPIAYCECERYARSVLISRMAEGVLPNAPIWDDVRTLLADDLPVLPDIIYGGFPCQDISVAGLGKGLAGERSGLVVEILRLAEESRPTYVFLENVPAIRTRGAETVIKRLAELGYDARWGVLSAFDVGAPHKRDRWWCLATNADGGNLRHGAERVSGRRTRELCAEGQALARDDGATQPLAHADGTRLEVRIPCEDGDQQPSPFGANWWATEPNVGRVAHGIPYRVDRIRGLGNAVVPAQAREAFQRLAGLK